MPELPEISYASKFINKVCDGRVFGGKIVKSDLSKNCEITWTDKSYKITSISRGKELIVILTSATNKLKCLKILFHFGMSGVFKFTTEIDLHKHSHLRFFTADNEPNKVLSFVDFRRFGTWKITDDWSLDRGPDPISEYELFRKNVLLNLNDNAFKKPICEALLNQKYFNGIGNYLRAEILFRAAVKPFDNAKSVLEKLTELKTEEPDALKLCHNVALEATNLGTGSTYDPDATKEDHEVFVSWIKCYDKPGMKNMKDHNKRTIWFSGEAGPLVPKNSSIKTKSVEKITKKAATGKTVKKESEIQKRKNQEVKVEENSFKRTTRSSLKKE